MSRVVVIDGKGEVWPAGIARLSEGGIEANRPSDLMAYAVRDLGFVLVRPTGRVVRVEMRPALVKPATLIALYYHLVELRPQIILLQRWTPQGSSHELFNDLGEFAATIERDVEDEAIRRHRPNFMMVPRSLGQLERPRYAGLLPILDLWRATRADGPAEMVRVLVREGLQSQTTLVSNRRGSGRLLIEHVGSGYSYLGNACRSLLLLGQDLECLPDPEFGCWVADAYRVCLDLGRPRLESASAVMLRPDGKRVWSYYDRLLLPWTMPDGTRYLLSASEIRRRVVAA